MYEFEHEKAPETLARERQRGQYTMREYIPSSYGHAPGSPGVYRRMFPMGVQDKLPGADLASAPGCLGRPCVGLVGWDGTVVQVHHLLESAAALQSDEYRRMSDNPTPWTQRMSPNVAGRNMVRSVYWQIYPEGGDAPDTIGRGMAQAPQIGRMDVSLELEAKYNDV